MSCSLVIIGEEFGERVESIVRSCSDSLVEDREAKLPWEGRKKAAIAHLTQAPVESLTVAAADKLHNLRDGFFWYHDRLHEVFAARIPNSRSVAAMSSELEGLRRA